MEPNIVRVGIFLNLSTLLWAEIRGFFRDKQADSFACLREHWEIKDLFYRLTIQTQKKSFII